MKKSALIIGAGVGGLACGAALARMDYHVRILEQHFLLGGYIQSFKRKKWRWNIGTHYLGKMDENDQIFRVFSRLVNDGIRFTDMDMAYEKIVTKEYTYDVLGSSDLYKRQLQKDFPEDSDGIERFWILLNLVEKKKAVLLGPRLFRGIRRWFLKYLFRYTFRHVRDKSLRQVLNESISNDRLKEILSLHCGKVMLPPDQFSFLSYALMQNSYRNGAMYPSGSGDAITDAFKASIEKSDGTIEKRVEVKQIIIENGKATGVALSDGTLIEADVVISNIGIIETIERLIPEEERTEKQRTIVSTHQPSYSYITLFLGFKGDLSSFEIANANYRLLTDTPFDFEPDPREEGWRANYITIAFPSFRNAEHTDPLHHTAEIIVPMQHRYFDKWQGTKVGKRGDDYDRLKEKITDDLLGILDEQFPGLSEYVAFTNLSTPLTNEYYTRHKYGAAAGIAPTTLKLNDDNLHPASGIENLYYTGADIISNGIMGAFVGGIFTASNICNRNLLEE